MDEMVSIFFVAVNIGLCVLAGSLLSFRVRNDAVYLPLTIFFFLFAFLNFTTVMNHIAPQYDILLSTISITIVALLLWPMFWFYLEGVTHVTRWQFRKCHVKHLVPTLFGLFTAILIVALPQESRLSFFDDNAVRADTPLAITAMISLSLVLIIWCLQTAIYFFLGLRRLLSYRRRLKDIFASTENRELTWLLVLFLCLGITGLFAFLDLFFSFVPEGDSNVRSATWEEFVLMVFLFTLAIWGLRQTPGFEQIYKEQEQEYNGVPSSESKPSNLPAATHKDSSIKYQKSGLDNVRATRIAGKLEKLMQTEELYLDPNLSLPMLAKKIGVSTNILSQTLNENIKSNFFDYVNSYRIAASLPMITKRKNTILTVAMTVGFNSRSAFYKAFKRETGTTPGSYLKMAHS